MRNKDIHHGVYFRSSSLHCRADFDSLPYIFRHISRKYSMHNCIGLLFYSFVAILCWSAMNYNCYNWPAAKPPPPSDHPAHPIDDMSKDIDKTASFQKEAMRTQVALYFFYEVKFV